MAKIKVLVVDDSAVMRQFLSEKLSQVAGIKIIGTAADAYAARDKILSLRPDIITLDIEMPKINGLNFLKKIMKHYPIPVIIFSSRTKTSADTTLDALNYGAVDFLEKPKSAQDINRTIKCLAEKIKSGAKSGLQKNNRQITDSNKPVKLKKHLISNKIIAIGASTGGTVALTQLLKTLPENFPPILIVQHMPPKFTKAFADRLNNECRLTITEAKNRDPLASGSVLIAPGDYHMELMQNGCGYYVKLNTGKPVNNQRPSVDVLFSSVARFAGRDAIGVILTGMGSDGANGLLEMKNAGAYAIAQDKDSSIVFGMPQQAIKLGAVDQVKGLDQLPALLIDLVSNGSNRNG